MKARQRQKKRKKGRQEVMSSDEMLSQFGPATKKAGLPATASSARWPEGEDDYLFRFVSNLLILFDNHLPPAIERAVVEILNIRKTYVPTH
jgi:hypothetical protein